MVVTAFAQQSDRVLLRAWLTLTIVDVMARSRERLSNHIETEMIGSKMVKELCESKHPNYICILLLTIFVHNPNIH